MSNLTLVSDVLCCAGRQQQFKHYSETLNCEMHFSIFLPPNMVDGNEKAPVLYWLSGLTCTDQNFVTKAGAQKKAAELGLAIVAPDTSPRGDQVPDAPDGAYDLGLGAGFYVNATQAPWSEHYKMYDYVVNELPTLIESNFNVSSAKSIAGHSMGGHGALTIGLKNPDTYTSISAFAPIVNPSECAWGQKALGEYLGADVSTWADYDACELLKNRRVSNLPPIVIDQGLADDFYESQKLTRPFDELAQTLDLPIKVGYHDGYDHSYFFIATFIDAHLAFHYACLTQTRAFD